MPVLSYDQIYRYENRFVGQILDTCGSKAFVIVQKEWVLCFEVSAPAGNSGVVVTSCSSARAAGDVMTQTTQGTFTIAGRQATIVLVKDGDLVLGSVGLPAFAGESLHTSDVVVSLPDGIDIPFPDEPLAQSGSALRSTWFVPVAATLTNPSSSIVEVMVEFQSDAVLVTLDLCMEQRSDVSSLVDCLSGAGIEIGPHCVCHNLDGDQDVDLIDFAVFQVNFTGN